MALYYYYMGEYLALTELSAGADWPIGTLGKCQMGWSWQYFQKLDIEYIVN